MSVHNDLTSNAYHAKGTDFSQKEGVNPYPLHIKRGSSCTEHVWATASSFFSECARQTVRLYAALYTMRTRLTLFKCFFKSSTELSDHLYNQGITECQRIYLYGDEGIPKATQGKKPVYLLENVPDLVLKHLGAHFVHSRFANIQRVHSILNKQNSSHLVVPKARIYGDFLIEERLPIQVDSYHNMGVYLSHLPHFDEPVREMTRLFSQVSIFDIVNFSAGPLGTIEGVEDFVCYHNLPFYRVEKKGKKEIQVGLIDLEYLPKPSPKELENLARIFPFHLHLIKEEAIKLNMPFNENALETAAARGKIFLQVGYADHCAWLQQKNASTRNLPALFEIDARDKQDFIKLIKSELLRLNEGVNDLFVRRKWKYTPPKKFFTEPQEAALALAPQIAALMIQNMQAVSKTHQDIQMQRLFWSESQPALSESDLVRLRSVELRSSRLVKEIDTLLSQKSIRSLGDLQNSELAEQLCYTVMQDLVKKGKLFSFDSNRNGWSWIRY